MEAGEERVGRDGSRGGERNGGGRGAIELLCVVTDSLICSVPPSSFLCVCFLFSIFHLVEGANNFENVKNLKRDGASRFTEGRAKDEFQNEQCGGH